MFSIGYAACLHSKVAAPIMVLPAKEGRQRQYFDTMKRNKIMYVSTVKTTTEATTVIRSQLTQLDKTEKQKSRIVSILAISLADLVSLSAPELRSFEGCKGLLKDIVKGCVAKNEDGKPENGEVQRLMSSAGDAIKLSMLVFNGETTGFVAGYVRNDGAEYVDAATYNGMTKEQKARHSAEVFWNMSKTFPAMKMAGSPVPTPDAIIKPSVNDMGKAYKRHFENAPLNADQTGLEAPKRDNAEGVINSPTEARKTALALIHWLKDGNLLSAETDDKAKKVDGATLKRLAELAQQIDISVEENAKATRVADADEKAA